MHKLALTFYSVLRMPIHDIISCAIAAERAGFRYISVAESFYRDGFALASAIAAHTQKIRLGTSVLPIYTRTPFQLAMGTATLQDLSNGRVAFLGLGTGYRSRTEEYFGIKQVKRLERMREYIKIIRGLLSGKFFTYQGQFFAFHGFPPLVSRPFTGSILLGCSGPKMLRLAGEIADGVILNSIGTPEYFRYAASLVSEGARAAGRDGKSPEIAASIVFSVADKHDEAVDVARPDVLFYVLYPELDPIIERTPYVETVAEIRRVHAQGHAKKALSLVTDDMVEDLTVSGTSKECRTRLRKLCDYHITLPVVRVSVQPLKEELRKQAFLQAVHALSKL